VSASANPFEVKQATGVITASRMIERIAKSPLIKFDISVILIFIKIQT
jgi:hypothetical protein